MPNFQIKLYDYAIEDISYCIGGGNLTALYVSEMLTWANGQDVDVHISSVGGSAFDALGIYDVLKKYPGKVTTYIDALAASAASIIAMAGATVIMSKYALLMVHKPVANSQGNADDLTADINLLNIVQSRLAGIYMEKTGLPLDDVNELINAATWMDAETALALNFIDQIEDYSGSEITNMAHFAKHVNTAAPLSLKKVFNKLSTIQNTAMDVKDKELIEKTTSVMDKILSYFKKSEVKTITNKGTLVSHGPLAKGVVVMNDAGDSMPDDEYTIDNAGKKVMAKVEGGVVTNISDCDDTNDDNDDEVMNAAKGVLNVAGISITNKAEITGVAKIVGDYQKQIADQNAIIVENAATITALNTAVARDEKTIRDTIQSEFDVKGSNRSDKATVNNQVTKVPKFIQDRIEANPQLKKAVENSMKQVTTV